MHALVFSINDSLELTASQFSPHSYSVGPSPCPMRVQPPMSLSTARVPVPLTTFMRIRDQLFTGLWLRGTPVAVLNFFNMFPARDRVPCTELLACQKCTLPMQHSIYMNGITLWTVYDVYDQLLLFVSRRLLAEMVSGWLPVPLGPGSSGGTCSFVRITGIAQWPSLLGVSFLVDSEGIKAHAGPWNTAFE
jgi:hypothetical protein